METLEFWTGICADEERGVGDDSDSDEAGGAGGAKG